MGRVLHQRADQHADALAVIVLPMDIRRLLGYRIRAGLAHNDPAFLPKKRIGKTQRLSTFRRDLEIGRDNVRLPAVARRHDGAVIIDVKGDIGVQPGRQPIGKLDIVAHQFRALEVAVRLHDAGSTHGEMVLWRGRQRDFRHVFYTLNYPAMIDLIQ